MIRRTFIALTAAASFLSAPAFAAEMDIVDTAIANGNFKTLAAALTAAGLVETLKGPGPFTVFAPTDAAFAALPAGTVDAWLAQRGKLGGQHKVPRLLNTREVLEAVLRVATEAANRRG